MGSEVGWASGLLLIALGSWVPPYFFPLVSIVHYHPRTIHVICDIDTSRPMCIQSSLNVVSACCYFQPGCLPFEVCLCVDSCCAAMWRACGLGFSFPLQCCEHVASLGDLA